MGPIETEMFAAVVNDMLAQGYELDFAQREAFAYVMDYRAHGCRDWG